jgi:hypothetical protein
MRCVCIVLFSITSILSGQNSKKISEHITLVEEFTIEDYKSPKEIIFLSSGHYEYEYFYSRVFRRIKKETKKEDVKIDFIFREVKNWKQKIQFYKRSNFESQDENSPIVCFYEHGAISPEIKKYCESGKCEFYFYVTLVDTRENKILLKRKYKVNTKTYYYTQCENLAEEIIKELKLLE